MTVFSAAMLLFLVMDPFGNLPLFIVALKAVDQERHLQIIIRELIIALLVLVVFLFSGKYLLSALQISESALSASGGIILFLIAIKMIFPETNHSLAEDFSGEPFIVPLAIPYVAGPSALTTVLLIMNREPARWPEWLVALFIAWLFSGLIMSSSSFLSNLLGEKGLIAIGRLMGMLLVVIAIQMLMNGIAEYISSL